MDGAPMEKARDENRRESVHLKEKAQTEVLREDLGEALERDAGRLLKKGTSARSLARNPSDFLVGKALRYGNVSYKLEEASRPAAAGTQKGMDAGKKPSEAEKGEKSRKKRMEVRKDAKAKKEGAAAVQKSMEAGKRAAEAFAQKAEEAGTEIAGVADDENARAIKDSIHIYQRGVEEAVHAAWGVASLAGRGNALAEMRDAPISPQALRRKIRREASPRERHSIPQKCTTKIQDGKDSGTAGKRKNLNEHKGNVGREERPKGSGKRGRENSVAWKGEVRKEAKGRAWDMPGLRREGDFRKGVEEAFFRQQGRLHMQDNEGMAEKCRMSGISQTSHSIARNPAKSAERTLSESGSLPGSDSLSARKGKKKRMLQHFLAEKGESRRGAAASGLKKMGKGMGKASARSAGAGAKTAALAGNPGSGILLVAAGAAVVVLAAFLFILLVASVVSGGGSGQPSSASASAKAFSAKVESYRGDVASEARKYGMEGYVNLFLAVMEVESHGNGNDVFQCSESLGMPRNSLPVGKSIAQGVKYLASCIREARANSPSDMDGIRLAVQGYNFGNGYIPWAVRRDGGWTRENALEFARIHSKGIRRKGEAYIRRAGPWNYGDQYYADHVMEYYGAGEASTPAGACAKVPPGDRMKWLFPDGVPKAASQMKPYLVRIEVSILNRQGKDAAMRLTVHKKLAGEIKAVFEDLKKAGIRTDASCTAAYNWRSMATNSSKQSYHSYGSVVDWNWTYNPICYPGSAGYRSQPKSKLMADQKAVGIWKSHGFYWGGDWKSYRDYMHFTYTNN